MAKKSAPVTKAMTKTEIIKDITESTGLTKKDVTAVFEVLGEVVSRHVSKKGVGQFTMPGLFKIKIREVAARKAQKNKEVRNPRTGEVEVKDIPAKPATRKVKILPLKGLKDMALK